jgi:hypothetical protein
MRTAIAAGLTALFVCTLIAAGCGGGTSTTTSTGGNAQQSVPAAIKSCIDQAQRLAGAERAGLAGACTALGHPAEQALSSKNRKQAISNAALACRNAIEHFVSQQAQDTLSKLCDAIASAK